MMTWSKNGFYIFSLFLPFIFPPIVVFAQQRWKLASETLFDLKTTDLSFIIETKKTFKKKSEIVQIKSVMKTKINSQYNYFICREKVLPFPL